MKSMYVMLDKPNKEEIATNALKELDNLTSALGARRGRFPTPASLTKASGIKAGKAIMAP